jgi:hypothetical protein
MAGAVWVVPLTDVSLADGSRESCSNEPRRCPARVEWNKEETMFWNDPSLYGANFPYRDIPTPVHNPMMGQGAPAWQNIPQFIPPVYGMNQPFLNAPPMQMNVPPMQMNVPPVQMNVPPVQMNVPPMHLNPLIYSQIAQQFAQPFAHPFVRPFDVPQMRFDLPLHNFYRPFF